MFSDLLNLWTSFQPTPPIQIPAITLYALLMVFVMIFVLLCWFNTQTTSILLVFLPNCRKRSAISPADGISGGRRCRSRPSRRAEVPCPCLHVRLRQFLSRRPTTAEWTLLGPLPHPKPRLRRFELIVAPWGYATSAVPNGAAIILVHPQWSYTWCKSCGSYSSWRMRTPSIRCPAQQLLKNCFWLCPRPEKHAGIPFLGELN